MQGGGGVQSGVRGKGGSPPPSRPRLRRLHPGRAHTTHLVASSPEVLPLPPGRPRHVPSGLGRGFRDGEGAQRAPTPACCPRRRPRLPSPRPPRALTRILRGACGLALRGWRVAAPRHGAAPARRLPPLALDPSASAGRPGLPPPTGPAARSPGASHAPRAWGLLPSPLPPADPRQVRILFSRPPLALPCPLPAWRRFLSGPFPRPHEWRKSPGARLEGPNMGHEGQKSGNIAGSQVCEVMRGLCPA